MLLLTLALTAALTWDVQEPVVQEAPPAFQEITFPSGDELAITGDLYRPHAKPGTPFILLFHQAGWSRGEYREIAPKLNAMGFDCLAIDQRSGGGVNDVANQTAKRAVAAGLPTTYADAEQDLVAALRYVRATYEPGPVLLWGSSYSSALALRTAGEHPDLVEGVLAFAPGEYFERFGKPADWIAKSAAKIADPAFITSAKKEHGSWKAIFEAIPGKTKRSFLPETKGNHGSRALWKRFDDAPAYWSEVEAFLAPFQVADTKESELPILPLDSTRPLERSFLPRLFGLRLSEFR